MFGLFGKGKEGAEAPIGPPVNINWSRTSKGKFYNLMFLDTEAEGLPGVSGVFAIWKGGVKPQWLYAGSTSDLAMTLNEFIRDPELEELYALAGGCVSWALVKPEFHDGIVRYLNMAMNPEVKNERVAQLNQERVPMIAVFLPGREKR